MIDDNFDDIVRNMFEQFFSRTLRPYSTGPSNRNSPEESGIADSVGAHPEMGFVEVFEYENDLLVVVETKMPIENPEARISGQSLELWINPSVLKPITVKLPAPVKPETGEMSVANGVVEIRFEKGDSKQKTWVIGVTEQKE